MPDADDGHVTASQLAEMGYCERKIRYEALCGKRTSLKRQEAQDRGNAAHVEFFNEGKQSLQGRGYSDHKPWCFIATLVFGPAASETQALRALRDQVLRKSGWGRALIRAYYRKSPTIYLAVAGKTEVLGMLRLVLRVVALFASVALAVHDHWRWRKP